jgi:sirohydrochlorin ferrochelatase
MSASAYFVITHGSRSPRSIVARQKIEVALQARCPHIPVGGGCLEGQPQSLAAQMDSFRQRLSHADRIVAIPLFLLHGVHTQVDIPAQLPPQGWHLAPILGDHPTIPHLLAAQFPPEGERFLLSHGSNYPGAIEAFARLAHSIDAKPIYWQGEPHWQTCLNYPSAFVLPYFLAESYILAKIKEQAQGMNLLPTPFTPPLVAQMAQELAEGLE